MFYFNDEVGTFKPQGCTCELPEVCDSAISTYGTSRLVRDFTMYPDLPQIDVRWRDWGAV